MAVKFTVKSFGVFFFWGGGRGLSHTTFQKRAGVCQRLFLSLSFSSPIRSDSRFEQFETALPSFCVNYRTRKEARRERKEREPLSRRRLVEQKKETMECDLFSSLLAGTGARCFDPRTNASGMALFDDRRKKKIEQTNVEEEEKGELDFCH